MLFCAYPISCLHLCGLNYPFASSDPTEDPLGLALSTSVLSSDDGPLLVSKLSPLKRATRFDRRNELTMRCSNCGSKKGRPGKYRLTNGLMVGRQAQTIPNCISTILHEQSSGQQRFRFQMDGKKGKSNNCLPPNEVLSVVETNVRVKDAHKSSDHTHQADGTDTGEVSMGSSTTVEVKTSIEGTEHTSLPP